MDKNSIKEKFVKKIYAELQEFKESIMMQEKSAIYSQSYKVEIFSTLYEILMEKADSLSDAILLNLLGQSTGILEALYQDWLKKDDSSYQELSAHVDSELENDYFYWNEAG